MTEKENYLRAADFRRPDHIPMVFAINGACFGAYPQEALLDLMEEHRLLFPNFRRPETPAFPDFPPVARKDAPFRDDFGCVWTTTCDGITGTVTGHPLESWDAWESYVPPDPQVCMGIGPVDWEQVRRDIAGTPELLHMGGLRHGHTFLQLCDLRGYENVIYDMMDEEPRLEELLAMVEGFNRSIVERYLACGVDVMTYPEDLGMQVGPMLSPENFRRYIKPSYERLVRPAREKGVRIHMHSDGDIRTLADDILDCGIEILNLQDLVNGIDWIRDRLKGRVCIDLDIDRQKVTRFGTPREIDQLIRREVSTLGSREGGLMMIFGLYPGTPLENVKALMDAMERYMGYFN